MDKLAAAHARGPNWADPFKAWGDLLARQGRWSEALAKCDQALKRAPAWVPCTKPATPPPGMGVEDLGGASLVPEMRTLPTSARVYPP